MSESELIEEPREITARYLPNEGGIVWEGKAYLPADYVLNEDREPSDAEVEAVADAVEAASAQWEFEFDQYRAGSRAYADPGPKAEYIARAALLAAQEVRRADAS